MLAFGHPFLQRGDTGLFLHPAFIYGVVPSINLPFKIGAPAGPPIGAFVEDRSAGLAGRLGRAAPSVELSITARDSDLQRERTITLAPMGVRVCHDMVEGLRDADVVIMLRLQNERMSGAMLPSAAEFAKSYGLTPDKLALARPDAIVMHPGPINRGVEIDSAVVDGKQSVILPQVTFGIAVRMAVMSIIAGNEA